MKRSLTRAFLSTSLVLLALSALHAPGGHSTAHAATIGQVSGPACSFSFEAVVYQGPDTGQQLTGQFYLPLTPDGAYSGVLVEDDGTQVPVVGQVSGRSMTVLFMLDQGQLISGLGTADSPIEDCAFTRLFGPFVGPMLNDSGAWGEPCGGFLEPACPPPSKLRL